MLLGCFFNCLFASRGIFKNLSWEFGFRVSRLQYFCLRPGRLASSRLLFKAPRMVMIIMTTVIIMMTLIRMMMIVIITTILLIIIIITVIIIIVIMCSLYGANCRVNMLQCLSRINPNINTKLMPMRCT